MNNHWLSSLLSTIDTARQYAHRIHGVLLQTKLLHMAAHCSLSIYHECCLLALRLCLAQWVIRVGVLHLHTCAHCVGSWVVTPRLSSVACGRGGHDSCGLCREPRPRQGVLHRLPLFQDFCDSSLLVFACGSQASSRHTHTHIHTHTHTHTIAGLTQHVGEVLTHTCDCYRPRCMHMITYAFCDILCTQLHLQDRLALSTCLMQQSLRASTRV